MANKEEYGFKKGSRFSGDPKVVFEELERIRELHGELTSQRIVEEAQSSSSPIHPLFEWDDSSAAHSFRLIQARNLVRAIVVVKDGTQTSQYVNVRENGRKYEPLNVTVQSMTLFQSALQLLEQKLSAAIRAVEELREAAGQSKKKSDLAIIATVIKSLEIASSAIRKLSSAA